MDQNNYNGQVVQTPQPEMQPTYQQPVYPQPVYQPPEYQQDFENEMSLREKVEKAFSRSLIAVILASFPVCSIVAIFLGFSGFRLSNSNNNKATRLGVSAGGKNVAAKVMGIVAFAYGIFATLIYAFYAVYIVYIVYLMSMFNDAVSSTGIF